MTSASNPDLRGSHPREQAVETDPVEIHPMAPLIRVTLLLLYLALVLPLPLLSPVGLQRPMLVASLLGLGLVVAITSEQVELSEAGIRVGHPAWCAWILRRGWSLPWDQIRALTPVGTSQGGRVFYVRTTSQQAYLLPQRVARFEQFLTRFASKTGLDCAGVARLTPPWTYQVLAVLSAALLAAELISLVWLHPVASTMAT